MCNPSHWIWFCWRLGRSGFTTSLTTVVLVVGFSSLSIKRKWKEAARALATGLSSSASFSYFFYVSLPLSPLFSILLISGLAASLLAEQAAPSNCVELSCAPHAGRQMVVVSAKFSLSRTMRSLAFVHCLSFSFSLAFRVSLDTDSEKKSSSSSASAAALFLLSWQLAVFAVSQFGLHWLFLFLFCFCSVSVLACSVGVLWCCSLPECAFSWVCCLCRRQQMWFSTVHLCVYILGGDRVWVWWTDCKAELFYLILIRLFSSLFTLHHLILQTSFVSFSRCRHCFPSKIRQQAPFHDR